MESLMDNSSENSIVIKSVKFFGATRITKEELERITGLKYEDE